MKKVIAVFTALLIATGVTFAGRNDIHSATVWGGAGYSGLLNSYEHNKFVGGGGGLIGVGYQYQNKRFILHVGPEFRLWSSADKVGDFGPYSAIINQYDYSYLPAVFQTDEWKMRRNYEFADYKENQLLFEVMVPIMAGMKLDSWYWLAGVKVGGVAAKSWKAKGLLTTTMTDPLSEQDVFVNLPTHDIITDNYQSSSKEQAKNPFGLDVTLSAEAGIDLDRWMPDTWLQIGEKELPMLHYRLGLFVDYGLNNMNVAKNPSDIANYVGEDKITTQSLHQSSWADGKRLNSLLVGAKFTVLFQLNKPKGPKKPNPRMVAQLYDLKTNRPLSNARVQIVNERTKKRSSKTTDGQGRFVQRYVPGDYKLIASKADYITDSRTFRHQNDADTLRWGLMPVPVLKLYAKDVKTNQGLAAVAEIQDRATGKSLQTATISPQNGATLKLKPEQKYNIVFTSAGYIAQTIELDTVGRDLTVLLQEIEKGRTYKIENLFFATNQTTILPESEAAMQELFEFLNDNKDVRIRIVGHTDNVGSEESNQVLSEGRANSVRDEMIRRGIDPDRLEAEGKGMREPIATNDTEEGRQQNRRVEFVIL